MNIKNILIGLIILSGIFYYNLQESVDMFYPAQFALFIFIAGILISYLILSKNKIVGFLSFLLSFGFLKTYLLQHAPLENLFKAYVFGNAIFLIYYFARNQKLDINILKWFLVPAYFNIALVFIQKFDHNFLSFIPVKETGITGFLGNKGMTAYFLAMTIPIFLKYCNKLSIILLLSTIFLCSPLIFCISFIGIIFYMYKLKKLFRKHILLCIFIMLLSFYFNQSKIINSIHIRASEFLGVSDGIKHNPIIGWGLGSFAVIMQQMANSATQATYLGLRISHPNEILGHPHNEILFAWWNLGILFPIGLFALVFYIIKKFTADNLIPFTILLICLLLSMGYFLSPPAWFLLILSLAVYENKIEEVKNANNAT